MQISRSQSINKFMQKSQEHKKESSRVRNNGIDLLFKLIWLKSFHVVSLSSFDNLQHSFCIP